MPRSGSTGPTIVMAVSVVIALAFGVLWSLNVGTAAEFAFGNRLTPIVLTATGVTFVLVGWMITTKHPEHAVGRICLVIGSAVVINTLSTEYATYAVRTNPGSLPAGELMAWFGNWTWVGAIGLMGSVLVLLFPDGHLPGRGWRPVLWAAVIGMVATMVYFALVPGPLESIQWIDNPFGWVSAPPEFSLLSLGFALLALTVIAAAWSMRRRYVRARGEARAQIKWFTGAAALVAATYVGQFFYSAATGTLDGGSDAQRWWQTLTVAMFGALGVAVGIAILRHRLYEIDRIISRTVSYALVIGLIGLVFFGLVTSLSTFLRINDPLVIAAATLASAALFNPLRIRTQNVVDRRFNRSRYDAELVLSEFAEKLHSRVDADVVIDGWIGVVSETMQPEMVGVWLRET